MKKENVLAVYRVGRKIVAHVFTMNGLYLWSDGKPSDNMASGERFSLSVNAYLHATEYAKSFAEHIGNDMVTARFSTGESITMRRKNGKWIQAA